MSLAISKARENVNNGNGGPFGAVVVKNGKILAVASNKVTSTNDPTAHAEIVAIREACKALGTFNLEGCEIYSSCEPCPMCLGAIMWARIDKLYFAADRHDAKDAGFDDSLFYDSIQLPPDKRHIPSEQIQREDALLVFNEWKASEKTIPY